MGSKRKAFVTKATPPEEVQSLLQDDLEHLQELCALFDGGKPERARHISGVLRRLFEEGKGKGLIRQAGLTQTEFVDSARDAVDGAEPHSMFYLLVLHGENGTVKWAPRSNKSIEGRLLFSEWWKRPVLSDGKGLLMSRRDVVEFVANKGGGVHVDRYQPVAEWEVSRQSSPSHVIILDPQNRLLDVVVVSADPKGPFVSALDRAGELVGCFEGGPSDLASNPKPLDGFGRA